MALTHIDGRAAGAEAPARALWLGAVPLVTTSARHLTIGNDTPLPLAYCWEPTAADIDGTSAAVGDAAGGCCTLGGHAGPSQPEQRHSSEVLSGVHGGRHGSRGTEGGHTQDMRPAALQQRAGTQPTADACSCAPETAADFRMQPAAGTLPANAAVTFTASFQPRLESSVSAFARFMLRVQPGDSDCASHLPLPLIRGALLPEGSALLRSDAMDAAGCPCVPVVAQPVVTKAAGGAAARCADTIVPGCFPLAGLCASSAAVEVTLEGLALPAPRLEAELPVLQGCVRMAAGQARTPCSSCASRIVPAASMLRQQVLTQWAFCAPGSSNKWTHMNCKLHNAAVSQQLLAAPQQASDHAQAQNVELVVRNRGATATSVRWCDAGSTGMAVDPPAAELAAGGTAALAMRLGPLAPGAHELPLRMDAAGGYSLAKSISCQVGELTLACSSVKSRRH